MSTPASVTTDTALLWVRTDSALKLSSGQDGDHYRSVPGVGYAFESAEPSIYKYGALDLASPTEKGLSRLFRLVIAVSPDRSSSCLVASAPALVISPLMSPLS